MEAIRQLNESRVRLLRTYQLIAQAARIQARNAIADRDYRLASDCCLQAAKYSELASEKIREILG